MITIELNFISSIIYTVSVGEEVREIFLYSCSYPTDITSIKSFKTSSEENNKLVQELDGDIWHIYTIQKTQSNISYIDELGYLEKITHDDKHYYFLNRDDNGNIDDLTPSYRISIHGGKWESCNMDISIESNKANCQWSPYNLIVARKQKYSP